jgi:hypothetical protein
MARFTATPDTTTLEMALIGFQIERKKIDDKIREIQDQLKGKVAAKAPAGETGAAVGKRVLSAAARRRIALAQKKRWAEHRRRQAEAKGAAK